MCPYCKRQHCRGYCNQRAYMDGIWEARTGQNYGPFNKDDYFFNEGYNYYFSGINSGKRCSECGGNKNMCFCD